MRNSNFLILFFLSLSLSFAQKGKEKSITHSFDGYIKYMNTTINQPSYDITLTDNLVHNRLNYSLSYKNKHRLNASARNRIFWGESVKYTPNYGALVKQTPEKLNFNWIEDSAVVANTTIDRLNLELIFDKWEIILGRQRVNWGTSMVWNPNDIFNSFSFFDFDYEERPGSDAALIRYYNSYTSKFELVYELRSTFEESSFAFLHQFNKWGYDLQGFLGYQREAFVGGLGWTGDVKGVGFRGEATYFHSNTLDIKDQLIATAEVDHVFPSTVYLHASYLYNSEGLNTSTGNYQAFYLNRELGARTLSPSRHTIFSEVSYQISPAVRGSLFGMTNPKDWSYFVGPMISWTVANNFNVLLNTQIFSNEMNTAFGGYGQSYYVRFKYNF